MERIVHSSHDGNHPTVVADQDSIRILRFGTEARQSCVNTLEPHRLVLEYTRWMMTGLVLTPSPSRFLVLGLGGGAIVHYLLHRYPGCRITAVERSGQVIDLARSWFLLPENPSLTIVHADAAAHITRDNTLYNMIFVDIFEPDHMSPLLYDPDFYSRVRARLASGGVMAVNLWNGEKKTFLAARTAIQNSCGDQVLELPVRKRSNLILLGFEDTLPRQRIRQARKRVGELEERLELPVGKYLKKLRRTNRSLLRNLFRPL
ncbi:spermine/spermidine synthase domain-containing protein [Desulfolithobacter sp.]